VVQLDALRVQHQALGGRPAVSRVAEDGSPERSQVNADLMLAPGHGLCFQQQGIGPPIQDAHASLGWDAAAVDADRTAVRHEDGRVDSQR